MPYQNYLFHRKALFFFSKVKSREFSYPILPFLQFIRNTSDTSSQLISNGLDSKAGLKLLLHYTKCVVSWGTLGHMKNISGKRIGVTSQWYHNLGQDVWVAKETFWVTGTLNTPIENQSPWALMFTCNTRHLEIAVGHFKVFNILSHPGWKLAQQHKACLHSVLMEAKEEPITAAHHTWYYPWVDPVIFCNPFRSHTYLDNYQMFSSFPKSTSLLLGLLLQLLSWVNQWVTEHGPITIPV